MDRSLTALILITGGTNVLLRVLPVRFLAHHNLSPDLRRFLELVPVPILAALLASEVAIRGGKLALTTDNLLLWALLPSIWVANKTKSLFVTVLFGVTFVALARHLW